MAVQLPSKEGELKTSDGIIVYMCWGPVTCKQYLGKFKVPALQAMADSGMWYCRISGNPHVIEGEGYSPEYAMYNAISRTQENIKWKNAGIEALRKVLNAVEV